MRYLARVVLEQGGISVTAEAGDGPEALDKLRALEPPPVPTVVLLDNQMPGPSGLEVAAQILSCLPDQLIVLFSAYLSDDIVERPPASVWPRACPRAMPSIWPRSSAIWSTRAPDLASGPTHVRPEHGRLRAALHAELRQQARDVVLTVSR